MTDRPAFEPNPPRPYWQAELWHDGAQIYSSGPVGPGTELRAPIPQGGSWLVIRWLTSDQAQEGAEGADPVAAIEAGLRDMLRP
jgi:hypothetical protein